MKKHIYYYLSILCAMAFTLAGCSEKLEIDGDDIRDNQAAPKIMSFTPSSGVAGTEIMIEGESFATVDTVYIGGQLAKIKNRISETHILIEVTGNAKTGTIEIQNPHGKGTSTDIFNVIASIPTIGTITTATPGKLSKDEIVTVSGENMKAVSSILIAGQTAKIIFVSNTELKFEVPEVAANSGKIIFQYLSGTEVKAIESVETYQLENSSPSVTLCPTTANAGSSITITGANLNTVKHALLGTEVVNFTSQTATELKLTIPASYIVETTLDLVLIYNETEKLVAAKDFVITIPAAATILFWENKIMYQQEYPTDNFFDPITGNIYSPCDYETKKNDIYFYVSNSALSIQLNNPNNSSAQTKNFKCNGVALPTEVMPNIVKFRVLKAETDAEYVYIEKVKAKTLESIIPQDLVDAGIANAGSNTLRYFGNATSTMNSGDVILVQQFDAAGTVLKVGFIEVVKFTTSNVATDKASSITFNCYFQK